MNKVELYRRVFTSFRALCAEGKQPSSFNTYCAENGVDPYQMRTTLKGEFQNIRTLPGYVAARRQPTNSRDQLYREVYEDFKLLCAEGRQPGSFKAFYQSRGVSRTQMDGFKRRTKLKVIGLPGFSVSAERANGKSQEIPFESIIFEESGFLPAESVKVITVKIDGRVAVSFPADTDVDVIARFIAKTRKEAGDVEP